MSAYKKLVKELDEAHELGRRKGAAGEPSDSLWDVRSVERHDHARAAYEYGHRIGRREFEALRARLLVGTPCDPKPRLEYPSGSAGSAPRNPTLIEPTGGPS